MGFDIDLTDNKVIENGFKIMEEDIKNLNRILTLDEDINQK